MSKSSVDVLIRGGRIVDGTGNPWFLGDVALRGDRIAAMTPPGRISVEDAAQVVDAADLIVCPGFIDIQSHSIVPLMVDGRCVSKVTQGVTTEIMGEGWTPAPFGGGIVSPMPHGFPVERLGEWAERARGWRRFGDWLDAMVEHGVSPNVGSFLGGGTLREYACGMRIGAASPDERATMKRVVADAMDDGALGVSYALVYPPDVFADTDEIVDVCQTVARRGGLYITHLRSESDRLLPALEEAIDIGRRAALPVEVYHLKAAGRQNWSLLPAAIERIGQARADGVDVTADMYPYVGAGTGLASVLPPWLAEGGDFYEKLRDPAARATARAAALSPSGDWEAFAQMAGPNGIMPLGLRRPEHAQYVGRRLDEIAAQRNQEWIDSALDLLAAEGQSIFTVYFMMDEANLRAQIAQPWMKISTDAGGYDPAWATERGPVHPRAYGTYTRVLGTYVREAGVLPLEDAIRKMTSAVADRVGLRDRGLLRAGMVADVVTFDLTIVGDRATFDNPHQLSVGIHDVWVNGVRVVADGSHTGATPGRVVGSGR